MHFQLFEAFNSIEHDFLQLDYGVGQIPHLKNTNKIQE